MDEYFVENGRLVCLATSQIHLGQVICLNSPLLTSEGHEGKWGTEISAEDENDVVKVHGSTGIAYATGVGRAKVTYTVGEC